MTAYRRYGKLLLVALPAIADAVNAGAGGSATRGPDIAARQSVAVKGKRAAVPFSPPLTVGPARRRPPAAGLDAQLIEPRPRVPASTTPVLGPAGPETPILAQSPGEFRVWRNTTLAPPDINRANNEPSVANSGSTVFYTGNLYAARSTDGGATWLYLDPEADFPGLCCDQDVIYDPSRNLMFWFRMTRPNPANQSKFRIGVSKDAGASFCSWDWRPTDFDSSWSDMGWDYPQLALSDNHLYFTINVYRPTGGKYRAILARAPLDDLGACGTLTWTFWTQGSQDFGCFAAGDAKISPPVWTPVQGARAAIYLGQTTTNDCFTIWKQRESTTTLEQFRTAVPAWTVSQDDAAGNSTNLTCKVASGGGDPCQSAGHRVSAGWVAKDVVGFFWNAAAGSGFPKPYVNAVTLEESDLSYKGRPYLWSSTHAWAWAAAAPNKRGDLAIASWRMEQTGGPQLYVGIDDDLNGQPSPWEVQHVASSTRVEGPNWGHYLRVRPNAPANVTWIVSGFVSVDKGGKKPVPEPHYATFGRARDQ